MFERAAPEMSTELTIDQLEQVVESASHAISGATSVMVTALRTLDIAQAATGDGARSMAEWLAGRFDLETQTAKTLVAVARAHDTEIEDLLENGHITVDRAAAVVRLKAAGANTETVDRSWSHDLNGIRRLTGQHRRITAHEETDEFTDRYLHIQPSLDDTRWKLWGQLAGADGRIIDKAIHTAIDTLPHNPDTTASQDRADGLVSVASEWLSGDIGGHELVAEIFIDADQATITNGQTGASIIGGARIASRTLHEILCSGTITLNFQNTAGVVSTTPASRSIPAAIRRRVFYRDGHRCVIAGCTSRSRLQIHHLVPYSEGGTHDPSNLVTLCWYHHHVVIHQHGRHLDPDSPPQRRTFLRTNPTRAGP